MANSGEIRAVLDSNIYISGLLFGGLPFRVLRLAEAGAFRLVSSTAIQQETERVLAKKFAYSRRMIRQSCGPLWKIAEWVEPAIRVDICRDPDDNKVLECALAGETEYVVTGDRDLLELPPVTQYAVTNAAGFLGALEARR
ncbi:MAG: putative toxin-antitoxin system toxin component, PIN family [Terracidiphilus sp.]